MSFSYGRIRNVTLYLYICICTLNDSTHYCAMAPREGGWVGKHSAAYEYSVKHSDITR